ncbi:MAG: type II toxin-antitoxin system VapC family toxin [Acidobacteria bacterium]|nr:type II toxin-antitoxin system VapC family toxin [Acidobacteriota bacterium]
MTLVVDSSAILAILFKEPDREHYQQKLTEADSISISALNWWEVQVRMYSVLGPEGEAIFDEWVKEYLIVIEEVSLAQAKIAFAAFAQYKGRPARLNMGDCFAYALAKQKDLPLLFKGNDFAATDVKVA